MKTANLKIDLMVSNQINKEVIFNEAIYKLDMFINKAVKAFIEVLPLDSIEGDLFILKETHEICSFINDTWHTTMPLNGCIYYIESESSFFKYKDNIGWERISNNTQLNSLPDTFDFVGISGMYNLLITNQVTYLYLNDDSIINISSSTYNQYTLIIKQNIRKLCKLSWEGKILWPNNKPFEAVNTRNTMQMISFTRLPNDEGFLAGYNSNTYSY